MDFDTQIRQLAHLYDQLNQLKTSYDEMQMAFDIEMAPHKTAIKSLEDQIEQLDDELRKSVMEYFKSTGDKKPHDAITIRPRTIKSYDIDAAVKAALDANRFDLFQPKKSDLNKAVYSREISVDFSEEKEWEVAVSKKLGEYVLTDHSE